VRPRLVRPADEGDYFAREQVDSWGVEAFWGLPVYPHTPYYRTFELADRGLHTQSVFEFNTRRGTATIIPWREPAPGRRRRDMRSDEFDEHGVPRCKHCGGETTTSNEGGGFARRQTLGFYIADNGEPPHPRPRAQELRVRLPP
jgi:hypothetical protein